MTQTAADWAGVDDKIIAAIASGDHGDPFAVLGMHATPGRDGTLTVRAFVPHAGQLWVVDARDQSVVVELPKLHGAGFFAGPLPGRRERFPYRLRAAIGRGGTEFDDPYRFPPLLKEAELHLFKEGNHFWVQQMLGAHRRVVDGIPGVVFAVWAPNAARVSVVGDFNGWDGRCHPMRLRRDYGVWEVFIPGIGHGELYKYEIKGRSGEALPLKADPCGFLAERPPKTASIVVAADDFEWQDESWMEHRGRANRRDAPLSIYEVHLGSWRRGPDGGFLSYREIADQLVPYVGALGFTHIELLPVSEHPFDGSWGYQPVGLFAPTSRFGTPDDFRHLVQSCHEAGIGVLLDWVPAHFPSDPHGLAFFDGTCLYEHADPRKGRHPDWQTLIYNFGRREVAAFLISNALYWIREFHIDGLRVDAVASMLYLDYSRKPGEWLPNEHGGRENLEALAFLRRLNETVYAEGRGAITVAEESTAWPMVSRPTYLGGLGFGYKWNLGWMHDTLRYMGKDPVYRRYQHADITFGLLYAFAENFVLPLSHDEVVHGKGSLVEKMPGDIWQKFANLRLYYAFLYTQPGKKLLFMGAEFAQVAEWNHDRELDWALAAEPMHRGVQCLVADLNRLYREVTGLHRADCEAEGFEWLDCDDVEQSVVAYLRRAPGEDAYVAVVCNFTPVVRRNYRVGVPLGGRHIEILNTDAREYGGSGVGNAGSVEAEAVPWHGRPHSLALTLPPLAALLLRPASPESGA
jgi:1,4-alpha-glucan branching enzyme